VVVVPERQQARLMQRLTAKGRCVSHSSTPPKPPLFKALPSGTEAPLVFPSGACNACKMYKSHRAQDPSPPVCPPVWRRQDLALDLLAYACQGARCQLSRWDARWWGASRRRATWRGW